MKVYIVTENDYEQTTIVGIYATRNLANSSIDFIMQSYYKNKPLSVSDILVHHSSYEKIHNPKLPFSMTTILPGTKEYDAFIKDVRDRTYNISEWEVHGRIGALLKRIFDHIDTSIRNR